MNRWAHLICEADAFMEALLNSTEQDEPKLRALREQVLFVLGVRSSSNWDIPICNHNGLGE